MNNLTSVLLANNFHHQFEEWGKQGTAFPFDSGVEQRIVNYSIPAMELTISYRGLTFANYETIRNAYENNNSNTFIVDLNDEATDFLYMEADYVEDDYVSTEFSTIDLRPETMTLNASVWAFKDFQFKIDARSRLYTGKISLITSVFFNFDEYQDLFAQSSSYTRSESSDQSFLNVLTDAQPYAVDLKYVNNAIFSNIGQSVRHARNKGGLKRYWTMYWLLRETDFLKLLTFYRKNSGIMGEFGVPDYGTDTGVSIPYMADDYIEDQDDYILYTGLSSVSNARFQQDSFQYQKRIDGLFLCQADLIEVKL